MFQIWCKFHYKGNSDSLQKEQIQEVIARPAYFNLAFGNFLKNEKRWSNDLHNYFVQQNWFVVSDIVNPESVPFKGFLSRLVKYINQFLLSGTKTESNNSYTIAQKINRPEIKTKRSV